MNLIKCQKYLTNVIREKQEQEKLIQSQKKEIENLNNHLKEQERKLNEKEKILKKMKIKEDNMISRKSKVKKSHKKSNLKNLIFIDKRYEDLNNQEKLMFNNYNDMVKSSNKNEFGSTIENVEINLQDEFFNTKKKSEEKNKSGNIFKNISINKILEEFYNKGQPNTSKKSLNTSSININNNNKFSSAKHVNNMLFKAHPNRDEKARSRSNKKNEFEDPDFNRRGVKFNSKKSTPLNMVNKINRYGTIFPSDKNSYKDNANLMNRLKQGYEGKIRNANMPEHGHNHSLSISVVTINDEIVFNSETNPNENNFNLDDTEVSRSKNVLYKKGDENFNFEKVTSTKSENKNSYNKNSTGTNQINNNNQASNNINNFDKPIIQFNQFNTFQVKQDDNKIGGFFGATPNYDNIFDQPMGSKSNKKQQGNIKNLKDTLLGNNNNLRRELNFGTTKEAIHFDYNHLLTDPTISNNEKKIKEKKDLIYFSDYNSDTKKKRTRSYEIRKPVDGSNTKENK